MNDKMILYIGEKNISSWSMRGFLALEVKGLPYEERTISLVADKDRTARRKVSPTGKVPVLHAGDLLVPDSLAIVEFLEENYPPPAHQALWPQDRAARAHARWLAAAMHSGFAQLRESMSFNWCFLPKRPAPSSAALKEAEEMLTYWEDALVRKEHAASRGGGAGDPASRAPRVVVVRSREEAIEKASALFDSAEEAARGPYLFGPFGAADVMYAPAVVRLKAFEVSTAKHPRSAAYMDAVLAHPAVKKWMDPARALPPRAEY